VIIRRIVARGCSTPSEKADAVRHVAPFVAAIPDPVERSEYARRLALASDTDPAAVEAVVRSAARGQTVSAAPEVGGASEALSTPDPEVEISEPEERALAQVALIVSCHPELVGDAARKEMQEALPECRLKALVFAFLAAAGDGHLDGAGRVDIRALEESVDPETLQLAYSVTVDEGLIPSNTPPAEVLRQIVGKFVKNKYKAEQKEIQRRLDDPDEDQERALSDLQALLVRRRAQGGDGVDTSP